VLEHLSAARDMKLSEVGEDSEAEEEVMIDRGNQDHSQQISRYLDILFLEMSHGFLYIPSLEGDSCTTRRRIKVIGEYQKS
jgi:hypothetical protein